MNKQLTSLRILRVCFVAFFCLQVQSAISAPLRIGYNLGVNRVNSETMEAAKAAGISSIEVGFGSYVDGATRAFNNSHEEILQQVKEAKKAADQAGIEIWSIHMPFGKKIDLSLSDEEERRQVVALQKQVLEYCRILQPKIILFHPSWHVELGKREVCKEQLVKSATELNKVVQSMGATMVIENMLGPKLLLGNGKYERALGRTVEEMVEVMNRLPAEIGAAVDMNHIKEPEKLILALGSRLKHVHIADGDGEEERHLLPCSGKGNNDWVAILTALNKVGYEGPFMFESKFENLADLKSCYNTLYQNYTRTLN